MNNDAIRPPPPASLDVFGLVSIDAKEEQKKKDAARKRKTKNTAAQGGEPPKPQQPNGEAGDDGLHVDVYS
ncbi:MAG: hypothetical protein GXY38_13580 [Planctomycetes bacterium]|jgi:hypothetical protein|nr:hypothetical protein [Planctomycetota bacterium]